MSIEINATDDRCITQFAPVGALAAYYQQQKVLKPFQSVVPPVKKRDYPLPNQLTQVLLSIFTGCEYLSLVNSILRPERSLAQLYRIEHFADASTLSRTLDRLTQMNLRQLDHAVQAISHRCSRTLQHDWRGFLYLDFDLSGLPCGKQAQGSTKGYFNEKNSTGRQLARVSAINYHETLWSDLFPGNRLTMQCLQPAVVGVENALDLAKQQRERTVYRLDGGAGTDKLLRWLLDRQYHILAKGYSGRRAHALAPQVSRWDAYDERSWLGTVASPVDLGRPVHILVRKWIQNDQTKHSYYVTTLSFSSKQAFMDAYNQRGAAEIEQFRADKSGLHLSARRKQSFQAQRAIILLTDLAHNLLADFRVQALSQSRFTYWGLKRIVRDLLTIPGQIVFSNSQVKRIELSSTHPYAEEMVICLEKYLKHRFGE